MLLASILPLLSYAVAAPTIAERASVDRITPGISPNLCLQTTIYGGPLQLAPCSANEQAQALTINHGETNVTFSYRYGEKCLTVDGTAQNGASVSMQPCGSTQGCNNSQTWWYTDDNRIALKDQGLCLDVPSGNAFPGASLQVWECTTGNDNQVWNRFSYA